MNAKIKSFQEVCKISKDFQEKNKKIVFVHGIFDILHRGHVYLLNEARKLGDILIVGVDHDYNAKILKGKGRPINNHDDRMFMISNLQCVDFVFLIPSYTDIKNINKFMDDIYLKLNPDIAVTSLKAGKYGELKKESARVSNTKFVDISGYIHSKNTTKTLKILGLE